MNNSYYYEVNFLWNSETQGKYCTPIIPSKIEAASSAEFTKGIKEKWTPEHLFIAAVSSNLMATFLLVAENTKFKFVSFESNAIGKIEKVGGKFAVTEITLKPKLIIPSTQNGTKAKRAIKISEKACALANSIKAKIIIETSITVQ
jgi:organic hydroperoxide reductase OsmC/OhrA